jgi:hypothetical protein
VKGHHILAGADQFNELSQFFDLMPASRINYMFDFSGMYSSVSQVTYFNMPNYERRKPLKCAAAEISTGKHGAIYLLPAIMQLYPQVMVMFEDDLLPPNEWSWLMMGGDVFLVPPGAAKFYHSNDLSLLLLQMEIERV